MELIVILLISAVVGGLIGQAKGKTALGVALGAGLGLIGILIIICVPKATGDEYECPACGEKVKLIAKVCKHCKTVLRSSRSM